MGNIVRGSTKELFLGGLSDCISREDTLHSIIVSSNKNSSYTYPALQSPKYLNSTLNHQYNVITHLEWLSDNATFVSVSEDLGIRLFIPPNNLLEEEEQDLIPFIRSFQDTPITSFSLHPLASLYSGFCGSLVASNNLPLKLVNIIPDENGKSQLIKIFNIQNEQTERYNKIYSLKFQSELQFIAGSDKSVQIFDINRTNPISNVRNNSGVISCLTIANSDLLSGGGFYSGTFTNKVNIHDSNGYIINSISLEKGNGIVQIIESVNGRYLYCISRNSSSIKILDIRMDLLPIGELESLVSRNQRLTGDILTNSKGLIIGSTDGYISWYRDAELGLSSIEPTRILVNQETSIPIVRINKNVPELILLSQGDRNYHCPRIDIRELQSL